MSRFVDRIKDYLKKHGEIKTVSFDLFYTLVLRYGDTPEEVFLEAGKRIELPLGITAEDYRYLRQQAQKTAQAEKKKDAGTAEVSLKEISEYLKLLIERNNSVE